MKKRKRDVLRNHLRAARPLTESLCGELTKHEKKHLLSQWESDVLAVADALCEIDARFNPEKWIEEVFA